MSIQLCAFADEAGKTLDEQIDAMKSNEIRLLEIRNVDGQNVSDLTLERAKSINDELAKEGMRVFSIGSPIGKIKVSEDFEPHKEKLKHILKLCKIFNCDKIRAFSFFTNEPEKDRDEVLRRMNILVAIATEAGVALYHENEKDIYGDVASRVIDLLDNVTGLKSVYDPANFIQSGEDIDNAINTVFPRADYFHIKDVVRSSGELVPSGEGDGQIERMIKLIKGDAVLTVEPHLKVFEGYSNIDNHEMKNRYVFSTGREAFDCAVKALVSIIKKSGGTLV